LDGIRYVHDADHDSGPARHRPGAGFRSCRPLCVGRPHTAVLPRYHRTPPLSIFAPVGRALRTAHGSDVLALASGADAADLRGGPVPGPDRTRTGMAEAGVPSG